MESTRPRGARRRRVTARYLGRAPIDRPGTLAAVLAGIVAAFVMAALLYVLVFLPSMLFTATQ